MVLKRSEGGYGVTLWKEIKKRQEAFNTKIGFRVGNDQRVKFWKDRQRNVETQGEAFLALFLLAIAKYAWIVKVWEQNEEGGCWNPNFIRQIHDWGLEEMQACFWDIARAKDQQRY